MSKKFRGIRQSRSAPNSIGMELQSAIASHQRGELAEAQVLYEKILKKYPNHFDALHLLGLICYQSGQLQRAVDLIDRAIRIIPNNADFYSNRGNALQDLEQLNAAVVSYDKAIQLKPDFVEAYFNRGNALQGLNQLDAAVASYDMAITLKPDYVTAYNNRGNTLKDLKQFDAAIQSYDNAIRLSPDYAEAYSNRGNVLKDLKQFDAAVASYDRAIQLKSDLVEAYSNRGVVLHELRQFDAAIASQDEAIRLNPDYAEAYSNRGNALKDLKKFDAAIASHDKAIQLRPDSAEAYSNRGNVLKDLNQLDAAIASYDKAVQLKSDFADAYYNRGNALEILKKFNAAVASYDTAIQLQPDLDYLFGTLLHTRMQLCDWTNLENHLADLVRRIEVNTKASPPFPILALTPSISLQRKVSEIWISDKYPYNPSLGPIAKIQKSDKIRIGYFSADFRNHAVSLLMAELFEIHDRSRFELIAFSFGADTNDAIRNRLMVSFDKFIDVTSESDSAVAMLARNFKIDIAIDLGGHTANARIGIFSYRAAPIQVSYIGFPGTSGAGYIDYLIADKMIIPKQSQQHYSEKIVYLPNSFQVNDRKKLISNKQFNREELGLPLEGFIFCCFNNSYKIAPHVFDSWISILNVVTGSVLWLSEANQTAVVNLRKEAEKRGLDPQRLVFAKKMHLSEYLASYQIADLFLDTLPYNAGTTASDALWAGLPVMTCIGESFASRMAASLLTAINLPELITNTRAEYETLAIELATNPVKYQNIKNKLAANRLTTPLFDTPLFTKHLEEAYAEMYERYQADLLPDHIYIE